MKRHFLMILVGIFILGFTSFYVFAEAEKLPLTASSSTSLSSYGPEKAIDGDMNTKWAAKTTEAPFWIMFDTGAVNQIDYLIIEWYKSWYGIDDYDIQISSDGTSWEDVFTGITSVHDSGEELREINRQTKYIRFYINIPKRDYAILSEFEAYGSSGADLQTDLPQSIAFQASLEDIGGTPLEGTFDLTFRLYDVETGGTPLWEEAQQDVLVEEGLLDVELGAQTAIELPFDKQYWLGVEVEADGEMTPRFKFKSVPYSFKSMQ